MEKPLLSACATTTPVTGWSSRLTSTVSRLLVGIMNQSVQVRFVVGEDEPVEELEEDEDENEPDEDMNIEPVQWLDYDRIVQPHKQVVVKGYLRRLAMEIGPKAIWLYIGFHQAAWASNSLGSGAALRSRQVRRFSGLSEGAFWRLLKQPDVKRNLAGLVERLDPPDARQYRRGRDGRPHRIPIRYQVYMTPRLTRNDSAAIFSRLDSFLKQGGSSVRWIGGIAGCGECTGVADPTGRNTTTQHAIQDRDGDSDCPSRRTPTPRKQTNWPRNCIAGS